MEKSEEALVAVWMDRDEELRKMVDEHKAFERRLDEFNQKLYLTTEESLEKKRIQKLKLAGKDKIMAILAKYSAGEMK